MKLIKNLIPESLKAPFRSYLHSKRVFRSQAGQDLWVFAEVFNEKREGFFLEIGAHDGVELSNTYILEKRYNWNGICVEANEESYMRLKQNRRALCVNACLDAREGSVSFAKRGMFGGIVSDNTDNNVNGGEGDICTIKTITLERLLNELNAPAEIDYLSVDIEGAEERVLREFSFEKYKFNCITIERPSDLLKNVIKDNGYVLIKDIPGLDCFYVHHDFLDQYRSNVFSFYRKKYLAIFMG